MAVLKIKEWFLKNRTRQFEIMPRSLNLAATRLKDATVFKSGDKVYTPLGIGKITYFNVDCVTVKIMIRRKDKFDWIDFQINDLN